MEPFREITYLGQKILLFDYRGLRGDALLQRLKAGAQWAQEYPGENLLTLSDFTGAYATDEVVAYLQGEDMKLSARKSKKSAVIGVTGIKKIFLNLYNIATGANTRAFDDIDSAKQYLISE